jgi:DNA-binding response OmpR family regulator
MNSPRKILLIDNASDRKERIKALSDRGYTVFPALKMEEARSRCMRGGYDLIVVHAGEQQEQALAFCEELRASCPKQALLLSGNAAGDRDYAVRGNQQSLVERVDKMLQDTDGHADLQSAA